MKKHSFSTNIAMIPWNYRRTSTEMASLVKKSEGRLSVSVHGCDHTAREFGTSDQSELSNKLSLASSRMESHRRMTGVEHDPVMIFPQGVFSPQSLAALQARGFTAAVNTDVLPAPRNGEGPTVADLWSNALTNYSSFPLFTRRYPSDGLANFAFDALLGKPCLIVEHHDFFQGAHAKVVQFVRELNSLNIRLRWRSLGEVIRRSYQWRQNEDGTRQVRMFANELRLRNEEAGEVKYLIEKADKGSAGVRAVTANGRPQEWKCEGDVLAFECSIPSGGERLIQVRYNPSETPAVEKRRARHALEVASRRYLSEFRDNFLSRHTTLLAIAQKAKRLAARV
ncbi:MAG: hypothetical protein M3Y86_01170 [Verrucomicrobiota bacterium]|nr:hypothetical protein [Verrucomicrobiota bacterium]